MNDYAGLREAPEAMTDEEVAGMFQYWHNEHGTSWGDLIRRVEKQAFDKWTAYAAALLDELDSTRAERDALREDAERYRWLRDECPNFEAMAIHADYSELDAAIDSARGKGEEKP